MPTNATASQVGCPVVGIGASAGGLEALEAFFGAMPPDPDVAFVIVQHLAPAHPTILQDLLGRRTAMPVQLAEDRTKVEANRVYVIPPNASLTIEGGVLAVRSPIDPRRTPIDSFFRSLAEDQGENAICIVLSGTGTDGSFGLKAVKEHGGMAMAQDLDQAKYDSMPRSAIALGLADHVLRAEEMPATLLEYVRHLVQSKEGADGQARSPDDTPELLRKICALLQRRTGHDFSQYKPATLVRRIHRRMQVAQAPAMARYMERLRTDPDEVDLLFRDLLIGVTSFFRDPEAFSALATQVLPALLRGKGADDQVRVWVPGCASGEEAYSIAILLCEHLSDLAAAPQVKIFATDIDEQALETARQGRYPEGVAEPVSPERLERFFVKQAGGYRIDKQIREMCIFSTHNLISDPPFSRLDLISCRNVLIYLENGVQRRLVPLFHYALRAGGHLFLGPSESPAAFPELFRTLDKKQRIYRRNDAVIGPAITFPIVDARGARNLPEAVPSRPTARVQGIANVFERLLLDSYSPAAVVINERCDIVYTSGRTGKYLELPAGATSVNVIDMAKKSLRPDLHTAVHQALTTRQETVHENITIEVDSQFQRLNLIVRPMPEMEPESGLYLVVFADVGLPVGKDQAGAAEMARAQDPLAQALEGELRSTKEHLQTTIEELETSNEELKSANEEMLSTNEELQSTNEEMQTSKEELQSMNEELQTVNQELNRKVDELDRVGSDLQNLFASTHIATVFLDNDLRIKKFSAVATELFRIIDTDVGRPITDIAATLSDTGMVPDSHEVLETLIPKERQIHRTDGDMWYIRRIRPYRSIDNVIGGVVITFVDITELKRAQERAAGLAAIVDSSQEAIVGMTLGSKITSWNAAAERLYGYSREEAIGRSFAMLSRPDESIQPFLDRLESGSPTGPHEMVQLRKDGRPVEVQVNFSPVVDGAGTVVGAASISQDISERKLVAEALAEADRRKSEFLAVLGHELRNPLVPIRNAAHVLRQLDGPKVLRPVQMIERQVEHMTHLIDDLLDVTRIAKGKVVLRKRRVDLVELVRAVVDDWQPKAAEVRVALAARLPDGPVLMAGDPTRLTQVLGNLIHNSLKFTTTGGHVTVEVERAPDAAVVRVRDSGVGIDSSVLPWLFDAFTTTERSLNGGGLGLGLALAKGMVELHGGTITAESEGHGRGATFTVRLPPGNVAEAPVPEAAPPPSGKCLPRQILLVEDNIDVAESMIDLLEFEGHAVTLAHTGAEGIEMAKGHRPDVVLCDLGLPGGLDGYEVARALRADPAMASVYLISLSGHGQEMDKRRASEAGFDTSLTKPVDPDELERLLATLPLRN